MLLFNNIYEKSKLNFSHTLTIKSQVVGFAKGKMYGGGAPSWRSTIKKVTG